LKKSYYMLNPGRLSRKDNTLKFQPVDKDGVEGKPRYIPVENVDELYIFGTLDANSELYNFLGKNEIPVHFFDYYQNYTGSFCPRDGLLSGKVLMAQADAHRNNKHRLKIAKQFVEGAAFNMLVNLKYYNRREKELKEIIEKITALVQTIESAPAVPELMGIEGNIRKTYYEAFDLVLNDFAMEGRTKQPPLNEVNSLISFGNMLCYSQCLRAIAQTQLNPTISYLHSPGDRRFSLALDLAEIFKPVLVDKMIFKLMNKKQIKSSDFDIKLNSVLLKEPAKKVFLQEWQDRLDETIQHPDLGRKVSYKTLIRLECYKLVKDIMKIEDYKPFKARW